MTNNKYKILLVEDDGSIRSIMTTMLESAGYQVIPADTCGLAKTLFASHLPDVTILDLGLPDMDGMRMLLQVNMANIRRKFGVKPGQPWCIANELGVGYRMNGDSAE